MLRPTLGTCLGFGTSEELDAAIAHARDALQLTHHVEHIVALSTALRCRFLRAGNFGDFEETVRLLDAVPRPTFKDIGTASLVLHDRHFSHERHWVQLAAWLESQGYRLPARFRPGWEPSWLKDNSFPLSRSDYHAAKFNRISATRIEDGATVWLKLAPVDTAELDISAFFISAPLRFDARNRCCPLLDFLRPPLINDKPFWLIVTPLLRDTMDPTPETVEELARILLALGLVFMHENNVAHRDICLNNTMMDATRLIPGGWSPFVTSRVFPDNSSTGQPLRVNSRSRVPVDYYYIDFGLSTRFPSFADRQLVVGDIAQNISVPELSKRVPYDPFALDVRMYGDMIRRLQYVYCGLDFLQPVVERTVSDNPAERVAAPEVLATLRSVVASQSKASLLVPLRERGSSHVLAWMRYPFRLLANVTSL
ncbi:hypothetical protein EXIGLDRAFT_102710 [Exidia glandulosa HHB12029]|uniref:Protein kinase domain-containing protein n=1 Tax=Exidia glandulosa HHB12029 TaxID=1314781 RepID=A0A166AEL2_EXIGL|nr:hypothetical protein EXIGLDRAFT_102710 [Exidia glandulosa HHB12029]